MCIYIYIFIISLLYVYRAQECLIPRRAFRSMLINGRRINRKYIIAKNSFICVITIFRIYNMEENGLILLLYERK